MCWRHASPRRRLPLLAAPLVRRRWLMAVLTGGQQGACSGRGSGPCARRWSPSMWARCDDTAQHVRMCCQSGSRKTSRQQTSVASSTNSFARDGAVLGAAAEQSTATAWRHPSRGTRRFDRPGAASVDEPTGEQQSSAASGPTSLVEQPPASAWCRPAASRRPYRMVSAVMYGTLAGSVGLAHDPAGRQCAALPEHLLVVGNRA